MPIPTKSPVRIVRGDVKKFVRHYLNLHGEKFHALLCDPPYHLTSITERFGGENAAPAKFGKDGAFQRASRGFMQKSWDGGDIAFQPDTWRELAKLLHPGAFLFAFGGSRGYHRMAMAIEEAGLIAHPALVWSFGSGFPKATRIDKQIDDADGKKQKIVGRKWGSRNGGGLSRSILNDDNWSPGAITDAVTQPATPLSKTWQGHRYGLQALKPAAEFIAVFQKPYEKISCEVIREITGFDYWRSIRELDNTPALRLKVWKKYGVRLPDGSSDVTIERQTRRSINPDIESDIVYLVKDNRQDRRNPTAPVVAVRGEARPYRAWESDSPVWNILATGAGALNIEMGRIGNSAVPSNQWTDNAHPFGGGAGNEYRTVVNRGRWPANLVLSHHPDCIRRGQKNIKGNGNQKGGGSGGLWSGESNIPVSPGYSSPSGMEVVDDWECVEGCAIKDLADQTQVTVSSGGQAGHTGAYQGGYKRGYYGDQNPGYRDIDTVARFFFNADYVLEKLYEVNPVYCAKSSTAEREWGLDGFEEEDDDAGRANDHPTIKPLKLNQHLASLLLPPPGLHRRILVPFAGVMSEAIGALLAGWDEIVAVEREAEYVALGQARVEAFSSAMADGLNKLDAILASEPRPARADTKRPLTSQKDEKKKIPAIRQLSLFGG